jgi:ABC-type polysaccharide/polyol phosphate transport system ATPase subunit
VISQFCDRALLIDQGRIVMAGSAANVAEAYVATMTVSTRAQ